MRSRYVSASKVAEYINSIAGVYFSGGNQNTDSKKLRIWLLSCYSGDVQTNNPHTYATRFGNKLKNLHWSGTQIIGFTYGVTTATLDKARKWAAHNPLYTPIPQNHFKQNPQVIII